MRRLGPFLALGLVACRFEVSYDGSRFACPDGVCPDGYACVAALCEPVGGPDPDAAPGTPAAPPGTPDAAPICRLADLRDDFGNPVRAPIWTPFQEQPAVVGEVSGRLRISLAAGIDGQHYAGYLSAYGDARGQRVFAALATAPNPASGAQGFLKLEGKTGGLLDGASLIVEGGTLYALTNGPGGSSSSSRPYQPDQHRYLAIVEQSGSVTFQSSPDGATWADLDTAPAPLPWDGVRLVLGGGTYQNEAAPGLVEWDDVNGGGAPAGCAAP
jgi:hypothetical protein